MAVEVKHAHQTILPNDPTKDVSADQWNEAHTLTGLGSMAEADAADFIPTEFTADVEVEMPGYTLELSGEATDGDIARTSEFYVSFGGAEYPGTDVLGFLGMAADTVTGDESQAYLQVVGQRTPGDTTTISLGGSTISGDVSKSGGLSVEPGEAGLSASYTDAGTPANNHSVLMLAVASATQGRVEITGGLAVSGAISGSNLSGTNTGNQTSIVGITGTMAQFDTACSNGNFAYQTDLSGYQLASADLDTVVSLGSALQQLRTNAAANAVEWFTPTAYQPLDAELTAIAGLTSAADKVPYFTGSGTASVTDFSSVGRTLVGQTTQALMRSTGLGLGTSAVVDTGTSGTKVALTDGANAWSASHTWSGTANRFGTATTADALADNMMSASATSQKALVLQMKASPTAHVFSTQTSAGVACTSIQSDGGLIVDQRTGATYTFPLDVKYQGTRVGGYDFNGDNYITRDIVFSATAGKINHGGGNTWTGSGQAGGIVHSLSSAGAVPGGLTSEMKVIKAVTAIADATASTIFTLTIPNAAHSGSVELSLAASLGAGGAIGANEATAAIKYLISFTRTAGVNAVAAISSAFGSSTSAVAGATTITTAATLGAVGGAVGASNTFAIQVTITKGGGASANHTCRAVARLINANATGASIS